MAEAPTFFMMGTRLKGAELRGCIQDPSHILVGLGPCLGRGWRIGGPGATLGAWNSEVPPCLLVQLREPSEGPGLGVIMATLGLGLDWL